ncbi:hypothetical protein [Salinarimonas sp.]|uniref:hypothetical protein n=1 Tax=Salinarimonas sp. TaxID=2766526 RepID=UPI0032D8FA4C
MKDIDTILAEIASPVSYGGGGDSGGSSHLDQASRQIVDNYGTIMGTLGWGVVGGLFGGPIGAAVGGATGGIVGTLAQAHARDQMNSVHDAYNAPGERGK